MLANLSIVIWYWMWTDMMSCLRQVFNIWGFLSPFVIRPWSIQLVSSITWARAAFIKGSVDEGFKKRALRMLDWESIYTNQYWPKAFLVLCVDRSSLYTLQKDNCNGQFYCFHLILAFSKITHIGKDQIQIKGLYVWKDTYNRCTKLHRAMAQNKNGFKPNKIYLRTIKRFIKVFTALFVFHVLPQLKRLKKKPACSRSLSAEAIKIKTAKFILFLGLSCICLFISKVRVRPAGGQAGRHKMACGFKTLTFCHEICSNQQ